MRWVDSAVPEPVHVLQTALGMQHFGCPLFPRTRPYQQQEVLLSKKAKFAIIKKSHDKAPMLTELIFPYLEWLQFGWWNNSADNHCTNKPTVCCNEKGPDMHLCLFSTLLIPSMGTSTTAPGCYSILQLLCGRTGHGEFRRLMKTNQPDSPVKFQTVTLILL